MQPRTPRAPSDRGRYPEEAGDGDDFHREDTPSDDGDDEEEYFAYAPPKSEPMAIANPRTPAASVCGSVSGDDPPNGSPSGTAAMEVDLVSADTALVTTNDG